MTGAQPELFLGSALTDIANTKKVGDNVTEALMRRLHEKGATLEHLSGTRVMRRSVSTLRAHARKFGLAFPDYVPLAMRPVAELRKSGDFWEVAGENAGRVAAILGIVVTKGLDGVPRCAIPHHRLAGDTKALKAAWFVVRKVR